VINSDKLGNLKMTLYDKQGCNCKPLF